MRKLIIGLALAAGCRTGATIASKPLSPAGPAGDVTGAANPRAAVDAFMAAITAEDLQAVGAIWGTAQGPARSQMSFDELQKRELIMICYLSHDSYRILSDAPTLDGQMQFAVELKYQTSTHTGQFNVGRASDGRYYVFTVPNIAEFQDVCAKKHAGG